MPTPAQSTDSLDASIQAALKAVGTDQPNIPEDANDLAIQAAVQALNKPVRVITPDKGPADFLSGGYGGFGDALRRGAGATAGVVNALTTLPRMASAGLGYGADTALHHLFPNTMPTGQEGYDEGMSALEIPLSGEYARGGEYTQGMAGKAFQKAVETGGTGAAEMMDAILGPAKTPAEQAKREALTRTGGETAINLAMLAIGGKAGDEAVNPRGPRGGGGDGSSPGGPGGGAPPPASPVAENVPRETSGGPPGSPPPPPPETDFQARMQAAVPKKATPEPVTPAAQEANVSALEAPYRATPADPVSVMPKLPKYLAGARPKYGDVTLQFQSDLDRAAYIVGNPRTSSARHADYLEWLAKALGTDENTALFLAKRSLAATRAVVKSGVGDRAEPGSRGMSREHLIPAYLKPAQPGAAPSIPVAPETVHEAAPGAPATIQGDPIQAVDKALAGTKLTRTPVPPGGLDQFTQANNLRIGTGEGQPLPYTQYVRDSFPSPADEVISTIGEHVLQEGKGDPTRVHLSPEDTQALNQALAARGWPKHRIDFLEKLSAAVDYARQNRQIRNEGYAPMRAAIQDNRLMGDMLKHPENYAVTARLDEFKPSRDFEKVCTP